MTLRRTFRSLALARALVSSLAVPPTLWLLAVAPGTLALVAVAPVAAQTGGAGGGQVTYRNPADSTLLTADLALPRDGGPHPGVVLLSIAGTEPLVRRLVREGYAVLTPVRRGFVAVEPLLGATFADLAGDVRAALSYLATRADVDARALAVVAQSDDSPPAMLAAVGRAETIPLVLMAPPALPGVEAFRRSQLWLAERAGRGGPELRALEGHIERIVEIALADEAAYAREYRLQELLEGSGVLLPRNAAFPPDERQAHFFASPLWRDRLAFDPEDALARLRGPVLVLVGTEDANTPADEYLAAVERGFARGSARDAAVCLLPGRTRHTFTDASVEAVVEWLDGRVTPGRGAPSAGAPPVCLEEPPA